MNQDITHEWLDEAERYFVKQRNYSSGSAPYGCNCDEYVFEMIAIARVALKVDAGHLLTFATHSVTPYDDICDVLEELHEALHPSPETSPKP